MSELRDVRIMQRIVAGDRIFTGDWNGDGTDTLAVYRSSNATTYLVNTLTTSPADTQFTYGTGTHHPAT